MKNDKVQNWNGWFWVPSLYLAEGIPYVFAMSVSTIMYQNLGISNSEITLYTSLLYLPWVIKPIWSPFVDNIKTKRFWVVLMQSTIFVGLIGIVLSLNSSSFFLVTLVFFYLIALSSATHDIAADGFYMLALNQHDQSLFVGIRSTFYRLAMIFCQGGLVILAGYFQKEFNDFSSAWIITISIAALLFIGFTFYHKIILPYPSSDEIRIKKSFSEINKSFIDTFISFLKKKQVIVFIVFILLYRLGEGQLAKIAPLFLLGSKSSGGLALDNKTVGFVYGTVGIIALMLGGILGGIVCAKKGLKFWIWWMLIAINLPDLVYVYLSFTQPENIFIINVMIAIEQFGYGFGFTAFMMILIYISDGRYKTAHYAIATGIMALGMMVPGMISGMIQEAIGYQNFFIWVCISTIPAFIITKFLKIDPEFGKKTNAVTE
jgi:MFS transporter, PAT family, beta-lactamase induction signal transducer AmpG